MRRWDKRAIETLGNALTGTDRALVVAFPTMALRPGTIATVGCHASSILPPGRIQQQYESQSRFT